MRQRWFRRTSVNVRYTAAGFKTLQQGTTRHRQHRHTPRRTKRNNKEKKKRRKKGAAKNQQGTTRRRHTHTHTHSQRRKGGAAINWLLDHHVLRQTKSCQHQYTRRSCQWLKWLQISIARVSEAARAISCGLAKTVRPRLGLGGGLEGSLQAQ